MEFWVAGAVVTALFMGMNEGAAGVAAAMSGAYGGGVIPKRKALLLVAVFVLLGSVAGSRAIIGTLSKGIVPAGMIDLRTAVVILFAASVCLSAATWLKVPISTSQATVGAITGAGIYLGSFNSAAVLKIIAFWILMPLVAFGLAYWFELKAYSRVLRWFGRMRSPERIRRILSLGALTSGCFMAFSFGTNNAGNVAAPLVGAGFWSPGAGALISGIFLGAGALVLGGRLLGTTREIHTLCSIKAGVLTI
ncbi:MAG: inorganic phosphate transporter, partial [Firmicutes bacterium]|nr:inorganic phosphate transporter [Bacillota bacterium]